MIWTGDFETNNSKTDCRVWSWGLNSVDNPELYYHGTTISEFIEFVKQLSYEEDTEIWFHNLKFDGEFIVNFLLQSGYTWNSGEKKNYP